MGFRFFTETEKTAIAFLPCVTGTLSIIGSSLIVRKVIKKPKRETNTYHRLLLGMSILDIPFSLSKALATLPVPADTGAIGAMGTPATCAAAGAFAQWGSIPPIYMASLSIYFMLKIRYNVSDSVMAKRYELFLHGAPWFICFVTCVVGLALEVFNPTVQPELGCWIGGYPHFCTILPWMECIRGQVFKDHRNLVPWMFSYLWLF